MGFDGPLYRSASSLAGPLREGRNVEYRDTLSPAQKRGLRAFGCLLVLSSLALSAWIVAPTSSSPAMSFASGAAVVLMLAIEGIRIAQSATLWAFARHAADPVPLVAETGLRVAVLATIVPGKEPFDLVVRTLEAMKQLTYDGFVEVWLLDEGDDPDIRRACAAMGVRHFSRKGRPEWNTAAGPYKARTKHGNHNAWRAAHENEYDVVAQMDPDHVPTPDFLQRSLGYFSDPDVGFVVAPQVYGNLRESWIARAAGFQAYVFHGIIQRGGNGMRAPLLIGTNHLYRVSAFIDIGGYQDSIIEDHLTSMVMYSKRNARGEYWRGVYTPDILAVGEGPTSFTDYFNQQKRWAYGIWQIAGEHSPRVFNGMRPAQRLSFAMLQFFYPSVAVSWVLSFVLTGVYLTADVDGKPLWQWAVVWGISMSLSLAFFLWLRRFNLVEHERSDLGLHGMALLLMCMPVYVSAAFQAVCRRALSYAVTAKGSLTSPDGIRTFAPHLGWAGAAVPMLSWSLSGAGTGFIGTRTWLVWLLLASVSPFALYGVGRWRVARRRVGRVLDRLGVRLVGGRVQQAGIGSG